MAKNYDMIIAGFGGQGVLFIGKVIAYAGMLDGRQISWLPSYGPEMRGGTANCSICISDEPIGSPLVSTPDALLALNGPSFDKFIDSVKPGGVVVADGSLVSSTTDRKDIKVFYVNATELANEQDLQGLANIIVLGKFLKETGFTSTETIKKALEKSVPARKSHLLEPNYRAIDLGASL